VSKDFFNDQGHDMKIGELSRKTGCPVVTIRYYEQAELLRPAPRTRSNYRVYTDKDVERLEFILHCRHYNIGLPSIKNLLAYSDHPGDNCEWVGALLDTHIRTIEQRITSLKRLVADMKTIKSRCSVKESNLCGIVNSLKNHTAACAPAANALP
jgi:DNA-binding transcriptional MerR regulator